MRLTFEKVLFLKTVPLFENIPESVLSDIVEQSSDVTAILGSDIVKAGEVLDSLYIVVQGAVRFSKGGKTIKDIKKGGSFGEVYAFDPAPIDITISAIDDTLMFRLTKDDLYNLINEHPDIARALIPSLCRRLRLADIRNI